MNPHRIGRIQEEIKNSVRSFLLFEVEEVFVHRVTITKVIVTKDLSIARIYYQTPELKQSKDIQEALNKLKGAVRKHLADTLSFKSLPKLEFFYDETEQELQRIDKLFSQL